MNALEYFMDYNNCPTREELSSIIREHGSNLLIPPHLCAHPNEKIFKHIIELRILDFVPSNSEHLICLCVPNKIDKAFYDDSLYEDGTIYDEFLYLHLENITVCPLNPDGCFMIRNLS